MLHLEWWLWEAITIGRNEPEVASSGECRVQNRFFLAAKAGALHRVGLAFACCWPHLLAAQGFEPQFERNAELTLEHREALGSYRMPIGPWRPIGGAVVVAEGAIRQSAYRLPLAGGTTLQLLAGLRQQLAQQGFQVLFECDAPRCGGFDFRFDTNVLAEPEMHIDLGDFRYLAARKDTSGKPEFVSLLVSRSSESGFVQVYRVTEADALAVAAAGETTVATALSLPELVLPVLPVLPAASQSGDVPTEAAPALELAPAGPMAVLLESGGRVALDDLAFATGTAELAAGDYPSLKALADYLAANPARQVVLVGHTDAAGGLEANIALSKRRAASVVAHLVRDLGVAKGQVSAQGVGYLVPRTSNLTEAGRAQNRRVEVVLTSTQ